MASAFPSLDGIECAVCLESMFDKRPLTLSCGHAFCTPCVKRLYQRPPLACPTCRRETIVPDDDLENLPVNFGLIKIMEQVKELKLSKEGTENLCQTCLKAGNRNHSVGFCSQCRRMLCQLCIDKHSQVAVLKGHQIFSVNVPSPGQEDKTCSKHDEVFQYVCLKCLVPLCIDCTHETTHDGHLDNLEELENGTAKLREKYTQMAAKTNKYLVDLNSIKKGIARDARIVQTTKNDLNKLRELFYRKIVEIDNRLQETVTSETSIQKADAEIDKMIDEAVCKSNMFISAEQCPALWFLSHIKANPSTLYNISNETTVRQKLQTYKTLKLYQQKNTAAINAFLDTIGKVKKLQPTGVTVKLATEPMADDSSKDESCLFVKTSLVAECISCYDLTIFHCTICQVFMCAHCQARQIHEH